MKLELVRYGLGWNSTLGKLFIDGKFACYTLEDECRKVKVYGETCIPEGTYKLGLRNKGSVTLKYAALYPKTHRGMIHILETPGFEFCYFHRGNREKQTLGCVLVGAGAVMIEGEFELRDSAKAYEDIYPRIAAAIGGKRGATLKISTKVPA